MNSAEQVVILKHVAKLEAEIAELEDCEQQWGEKWISERKENERLREALVEISEINTMVYGADHAVVVAWRALLALEESEDEG